MTLKLVDTFTVRDGLWEVDPRPYGLTRAALDKYGAQDIPGKGGASHIFVKAPVGSRVIFYTQDGDNREHRTVDKSGWVNFPMWKSAAYWPPELGPWNVQVEDVLAARGLGLPEGLHVSTFLIVEDKRDSGTAPGTPRPTPPGEPLTLPQALDRIEHYVGVARGLL